MKPMKFLALMALLSVVACGKGGGGSSGSGGKDNTIGQMAAATPGTYYSVLRPVNIHSNGFIPYGQATFTLKDDQLQVSVALDDDQPVTHRQTLHRGSRCPTMVDDTNGDNYIDYNEAMAVVGPPLMPLDGDLNSRVAGEGMYPQGRAMTYNRSASLTKVNEDLRLNIGFEGRVVLVHGTSSNPAFPTSIASYQGEPAHISLPVVCGVLKKI